MEPNIDDIIPRSILTLPSKEQILKLVAIKKAEQKEKGQSAQTDKEIFLSIIQKWTTPQQIPHRKYKNINEDSSHGASLSGDGVQMNVVENSAQSEFRQNVEDSTSSQDVTHVLAQNVEYSAQDVGDVWTQNVAYSAQDLDHGFTQNVAYSAQDLDHGFTQNVAYSAQDTTRNSQPNPAGYAQDDTRCHYGELEQDISSRVNSVCRVNQSSPMQGVQFQESTVSELEGRTANVESSHNFKRKADPYDEEEEESFEMKSKKSMDSISESSSFGESVRESSPSSCDSPDEYSYESDDDFERLNI